MKWAILICLFVIAACHTKGPPCFIDATDILKGSQKKMIVVKDSGYRVSAIYDEGWDSTKGGAYLFYPNELLKSYTFYQKKIPVYTENYDDHGYLINSKGSPMIDRVINELGEDSAYVQVYFFSPMKTYQQLNIKINNTPAVNYLLTSDSSYSNVKSVTFGINTTDLNQISMYSRIEYMDECTKTPHVLSDSIFLVKDSHTGLAPASGR